MANSIIGTITDGTYDVSKSRYEQLLKNEQKYFQYKAEMQRMGEDEIINIIEATETDLSKTGQNKNCEEVNEDGN
jgi:hypothetical protein